MRRGTTQLSTELYTMNVQMCAWVECADIKHWPNVTVRVTC